MDNFVSTVVSFARVDIQLFAGALFCPCAWLTRHDQMMVLLIPRGGAASILLLVLWVMFEYNIFISTQKK